MGRPRMGKLPTISPVPITVRRTIVVDIPVDQLSRTLYLAQKQSNLSIAEAMRRLGMTQSAWCQYISGNVPIMKVEVVMALENLFKGDFELDWTRWIPEAIGPQPKEIIFPYRRDE